MWILFSRLDHECFSNEKGLQQPTREAINHYLAGNLCRCTGYMGQLRAIEAYLQEKGGEQA